MAKKEEKGVLTHGEKVNLYLPPDEPLLKTLMTNRRGDIAEIEMEFHPEREGKHGYWDLYYKFNGEEVESEKNREVMWDVRRIFVKYTIMAFTDLQYVNPERNYVAGKED